MSLTKEIPICGFFVFLGRPPNEWLSFGFHCTKQVAPEKKTSPNEAVTPFKSWLHETRGMPGSVSPSQSQRFACFAVLLFCLNVGCFIGLILVFWLFDFCFLLLWFERCQFVSSPGMVHPQKRVPFIGHGLLSTPNYSQVCNQ